MVWFAKPQRALSSPSASAAARSAGLSAARTFDSDKIVARFDESKPVTAGDPQAVAVSMIQTNRSTIRGSRLVRVWISTTKEGLPGGTVSVDPPTAGAIIQIITADQVFVMGTDENGRLVFDVTKGSSGTLYVRMQVGTQVVSQEYVWA